MDIYYDYICIWNIKYENLIIMIVVNEYCKVTIWGLSPNMYGALAQWVRYNEFVKKWVGNSGLNELDVRPTCPNDKEGEISSIY